MAKPLAATLLVLAATLVASTAFATPESYTTRLKAPPGGTLTLTTDIGSVSIVGRSTHHVSFHMQAVGSNSYERAVHVRAKTTSTGVNISVHTDPGFMGGLFHWFHWFGGDSERVRLTLVVPGTYGVNLHTSGGSIDVRNIDAAVRARSAGGDADIQSVTGALNVHTAGGDIHAAQVQGPVTLDSAGGDVTVADSSGSLNLHAEGGNIGIRNASGPIQAFSAGGDIRAVMTAVHPISLSTAGGDITLLLPKDTHAALRAEASGGSVSCNFPLTTTKMSSGDSLVGTIGGGGVQISLHSAGGDIRVVPQS